MVRPVPLTLELDLPPLPALPVQGDPAQLTNGDAPRVTEDAAGWSYGERVSFELGIAGSWPSVSA
jgi:hypothetical protein